jgi:hypothetical protein
MVAFNVAPPIYAQPHGSSSLEHRHGKLPSSKKITQNNYELSTGVFYEQEIIPHT